MVLWLIILTYKFVRMKTSFRLYPILFVAIFAFISCKKDQEPPEPENIFTIEGTIDGLSSNLYYRHPDKEYTREYPTDSIIVTNGSFSLTDSISSLKLIRFSTNIRSKENNLFKIAKGGGYYPVKSMYLMAYVFPGATVKVTGEATDFMNAYPSGDEYNNSLAAINKITFPSYNESANLMVKISHETDSVLISKLKSAVDSISENGRLALLDYITNNPSSMGALWYLEDMIMRKQVDDEQATKLFANVAPELESTETYKSIHSRIEGIQATKEGMPVPEIISTATIDGSKFDITSLRGKYVLIDFWGVWCGPCVAEMPQIKAFQEKFKDQLVVLGINSGDTKEKMVAFLEKNDYTWQQLMSVKENTSDNFVNRFNVKGFPTKFIIDPQGKIVKRYVGSGEEAFELLESLMTNDL